MNDNYDDPATDLDAAVLDRSLRDAFNDIPSAYNGRGTEVGAHVQAALHVAWPQGSPPEPEDAGASAADGTPTGTDDVAADHDAGAHPHDQWGLDGGHVGHPAPSTQWGHDPAHGGHFGGQQFGGHDPFGGSDGGHDGG